jgi:ABC-type polysaccharide/polyol phosphate export permease
MADTTATPCFECVRDIATPAEAPDWVSGTVMIGIGIVLSVVGAALFSRRDLAGD